MNEKEEFVAESSPALSEVDPAMRFSSGETESDSNDSQHSKADTKETLESNCRDNASPNMTTLEFITAQWPGHQSVFKQIYPCLLYNIAREVSQSEPNSSLASSLAVNPSLKDPEHPSGIPSDEPLDLSSKTSVQCFVGGDAHARLKSRMLPISGRRTYTSEELNRALEDIISGKLGTRRAAVQYNIPRSTLRNKVYKISSEIKRETPITFQCQTNLEESIDYGKHCASTFEIEKNDAKNQENTLGLPDTHGLTFRCSGENLKKISCRRKSTSSKESLCKSRDTFSNSHTIPLAQETEQKCNATSPQLLPQQQLSPLQQGAWQNVLLQSLLLPARFPMQTNLEEAVQLLNALLVNQDLDFLSSQLSMKFKQSQQLLRNPYQKTETPRTHPSSEASPVQSYQDILPQTETPKTESYFDFNEALSEDSSIILRVPTFKPMNFFSTPIASMSPTTGLCTKNDDHTFPTSSSKILAPSTAIGSNTHDQTRNNNLSVLTSNHIPLTPSSESPANISLREVIAKSISKTFNQQSKIEAFNSSSVHSTSLPSDDPERYKRPCISVIKNIGGTDTYSFATAPNLIGNRLPSNHSQHSYCQNVTNSNLCGGKGTRPKRGKYRNYDRDSLVEAVKAVQRGEMSVHRAGSYYGVPHSTLEYKVKERHLMRPRKREAKSIASVDEQLGDNSVLCESSSSTTDPQKTFSIPSHSVGRNLHFTSKDGAEGSSYVVQTSNGIELPLSMSEQKSSAKLQYNPHLFWQGNFEPLKIETSPKSQISTALTINEAESSSSTNAQFLSRSKIKSGISCEFQQELIRNDLLRSFPVNKSNNVNIPNAQVLSDQTLHTEVIEKSSFLDGIIRKTLDWKKSEPEKQSPVPLSVLNNEYVEQNIKRSRTSENSHYSTEIKRGCGTPILGLRTKPMPLTPEGTTLDESDCKKIKKANEIISSILVSNKSALEISGQVSQLEHLKYGIEDSL